MPAFTGNVARRHEGHHGKRGDRRILAAAPLRTPSAFGVLLLVKIIECAVDRLIERRFDLFGLLLGAKRKGENCEDDRNEYEPLHGFNVVLARSERGFPGSSER